MLRATFFFKDGIHTMFVAVQYDYPPLCFSEIMHEFAAGSSPTALFLQKNAHPRRGIAAHRSFYKK